MKYGLHEDGRKCGPIDPEKVKDEGWSWYDSPEEREVANKTLANVIAAKCAANETERDTRIAAGDQYTFPGGLAGVVQLRNQRDMSNVNAVASRGQALVMAGDTTTVTFRDAGNVNHAMTGQQAMDFGGAVYDHVDAIYAASWAHKDNVRALTTAEDVEAYDYTAGWP